MIEFRTLLLLIIAAGMLMLLVALIPTRSKPKWRWITCPHCGGTGYIYTFGGFYQITCPDCRGAKRVRVLNDGWF